MQSVGCIQIIPDSTVNNMKAFLACSRSTDVDWLYEGCADLYPHSAATGKLIIVPLCSIRGQKKATERFFNTRKFGEGPVRFGRSQLLITSEVRSAAEASASRLEEPAPMYPDNVAKDSDDRDGCQVEEIWNLQDLNDQSASGVFVLQQITSLFGKK